MSSLVIVRDMKVGSFYVVNDNIVKLIEYTLCHCSRTGNEPYFILKFCDGTKLSKDWQDTFNMPALPPPPP